MYGTRTAFLIPLMVVVSAVVIGASLGAIAGYKGGWLDYLIMRITDLFLAFPSLLLAMAITAARVAFLPETVREKVEAELRAGFEACGVTPATPAV